MKADRCAQCGDDIGVAAHAASELIESLDPVFKQIRKAGLNLSIETCQFGKHPIEFLGKTISTAGIARIEERITKFLKRPKIT